MAKEEEEYVPEEEEEEEEEEVEDDKDDDFKASDEEDEDEVKPGDEDDDSKYNYGYDDIEADDLHDGVEGPTGLERWKDSWHEHHDWIFVTKKRSRHECSECEYHFRHGDLVSLGKRLICPDAPVGVIGVDRVHWRCSEYYSKKKDAGVARNFAELISKFIGGEAKMKAIPGFSNLEVEKQIALYKDAGLSVDEELLGKQQNEQKKRKREILESINLDDLDTLSFKDLQQMAKKNGIKANQKKAELINALKSALTAEE